MPSTRFYRKKKKKRKRRRKKMPSTNSIKSFPEEIEQINERVSQTS